VKRLALFITLMIIWLLLTWSLDLQQIFTGVVVAGLFAVLLGNLYYEMSPRILDPLRWLWFVIYMVCFTYYCIKANFDVAYRVLHPDMPIRPGIVKVRTTLKTDIAKTFLANSITLTPGTLTIDIIQSDLYIHWINIVSDEPEEQTDVIVRRFENILRRVFE